MLSYTKLSGNVRRFKTLMGMSLQEFDLLFAKVEKAHPEAERERLSKRPRRRAIVAGRRFALDLRNRVLLLFYYGTYDVAAEGSGQDQSTLIRPIADPTSIRSRSGKIASDADRIPSCQETFRRFKTLMDTAYCPRLAAAEDRGFDPPCCWTRKEVDAAQVAAQEAHPEAERERLSKRLQRGAHRRAIVAGRFSRESVRIFGAPKTTCE